MERRLIGLALAVLLVALGACKSDADSGSQVADDQPAGEVIELAGEVSAERAGAKRTLAVGDKVFSKDSIATADGASVGIRLFHNSAVWRIEGGITRELRKTAAWRARKTSGALAGGGGTDETAAAGRHGERSAGETSATARAAGAPRTATDKEEPLATASPPAKAGPAKAAAVKRNTVPAKARHSTGTPQPPPPPRPVPGSESKPKPRPMTADILGKPDTGGGLGVAGVGTGGQIGVAGGAGSGTAGGLGTKGGAGAPSVRLPGDKRTRSRLRFSPPKVSGPLSASVVLRALRSRYVRALQSCHEAALKRDPSVKGLLELTFTISASGRVSHASVTGRITDKTMRSCVKAMVRRFRFPASKEAGSTSVVERIVFAVR